MTDLEKLTTELRLTCFDGKDLQALLQGLTEPQTDYLCLRILDLGVAESARIVKRESQTIRVWRMDDPNFKALEDYLTDHRSLYAPQAEALFSRNLTAMEYGLVRLAGKINDWEGIKDGDKQWVMKACEMLKKLHPGGGGLKSYDELIMKIRRERKEE